jgi:hypothetical protein
LISVAHEAGKLNDLRAVPGNDIAIQAYREGKPEFPDGAVIARLAWAYTHPRQKTTRPLAGSNLLWPVCLRRGVQFMVKDSTKYASTGGWGFAQFNDGKPADEAVIKTCFPCHEPAKGHVFTRYAP